MLFAAGGELEPAEQGTTWCALAAAHLAPISLEREREVLAMVGAPRSEPDAIVLASFRADLDDALDREEERGWLRRTLGMRLPQIGFRRALLGARRFC